MKSVDGDKKPCAYCAAATSFTIEVFGPRGASKGWKRCCPSCGETPAKRMAA